MNPPIRRRALILVAGPPRGGHTELAKLLRLSEAVSPGSSALEEVSNGRVADNIDAFQRNMFAVLRSEWDDPRPIPAADLTSTAASVAYTSAADALLGEFDRDADIVADDPGLGRLLPLWYQTASRFGYDDLTLIPLRHPEDVVASCWLRDALARPLALAVWLESILSTEHASRARRRLFIRHDAFVKEWLAPLRAVAQFSGRPLSVDATVLAPAAGRLLIGVRSRELESPICRSEGDRLGDLVHRTWQAALALLEDPDDPDAQRALDGVRAEMQAAYDLCGDVIGGLKGQLELSQDRVNQALMERDSARLASSAHCEAEHARREAEALHAQIASSEKHVAELEEELDRLEANRDSGHDANGPDHVIEVLCHERAAMGGEIGRSKHEIEELRAALAVLSAQADSERERERELLNAIGETSAQLAQARLELGRMRGSTSWRATAPIRVVGRSLPAGVRGRLNGALRSGWRALTPWRNAERRLLEGRVALETLSAAIPAGSSAAGHAPASNGDLAQNAAWEQTSPIAPVQASPGELHAARVVRESVFFDAASYAGRSAAAASGIDPALHYVLYGEAQGFTPSDTFDPRYYGDRYPDIVAWGGNRLAHYVELGIGEGRNGLPVVTSIPMPVGRLDPAKPTVLVLVHEASRTGAPILGWNIVRVLKARANVVAVVLRSGALDHSFASAATEVVIAKAPEVFESVEGFYFGRRLADVYRPQYVISNSVETRSLVPGLTDRGVPVVALVHEFSAYTKPAGSLQPLYEQAAEVVFPADIVRRSSMADYPTLRLRNTNVLPQGQSEVPKSARTKAVVATPVATVANVRDTLRPAGFEGALLVVGMGFVDWRKGVDLFVGTLTSLVGRNPGANVRFVWIGHGFKVSDKLDIASYLAEQVERSGVGSRFTFADAVENVEDIYAEADVLFLSSRLDPLPNVSIDAALHGIPVVCFADASGMAEILAASQTTRPLVVPHLDAAAAADLIAQLADDRGRLGQLGLAVEALARERFNMQRYVEAVDRIGRGACSAMQREAEDVQTVLQSEAFDAPLFLGAQAATVPLTEAVRRYVALAAKLDYARLPVSGAYTRRPAAGFNPYTYALANAEALGERADPYAHYLRAGRPAGPWAHPVIRADEQAACDVSARLKVALHAHIYYPELVSELLDAVAVNRHDCRLIFTTDTEDKAAEINLQTERYRIPADVQVVGNRGRDIGPFLQVLDEVGDQYDVIGHVHGKRSLTTEHVAADFGERWRAFLWQHLIGDSVPMMDLIMREFARNERLGLVFPEDPHLIGWEENLALGKDLAAKMGLRSRLPLTLDFPVGTMFWARPQALRSLLSLRLSADDYPQEPLPTDGTILHAMERLITCVAVEAGFNFATTYLPQYTR